MDEGIVELVVDEAVLELLDEVQDAVVEVLGRAGVVAERALGDNVARHNFLGKDVLLIQEEHDGGVGKGAIVAHRAEQLQRFDHAVGPLGLGEGLVVLRQGGDEDDGVDLIEAVDPLAPLGPLAADVVHFELDAIDPIALHDHLRRSDARQEDVLRGRLVRGAGDAGEVVEVLLVRVDDVHRRSLGPHVLHGLGLPQDADGLHVLEELPGVVVGRQSGAGAVPDPVGLSAVLRGAVGVVRGGVVDEVGDALVVGLAGGQAGGVVGGLLVQGLLEAEVPQVGAKLPDGDDDVGPDDDAVHAQVVVVAGTAVQDAHLLEDGGLAGLAGTEEQELHLALLLLPGPFQLPVDRRRLCRISGVDDGPTGTGRRTSLRARSATHN
mmetsp:Transcript_17009/g.48860  ORF Transcript_17009/g.48860 Transcript_17009/m.48860 type:complete len:379 (+) Transcript_17009:945-2081(+)